LKNSFFKGSGPGGSRRGLAQLRMLSAAFEKTAEVLSRRAGAW